MANMYVCQKYMKIGFWTYTAIAILSLTSAVCCLTLLHTRHFECPLSVESAELQHRKQRLKRCMDICSAATAARLDTEFCKICVTEFVK